MNSMPSNKPKLSVDEQIEHLKNNGVKFDLITIDEAKQYLSQNNNYFKLTAYRKTFIKHPDGIKKDQYIDLDFVQLKDLAIIDMRLRYLLLKMALDVEHFSKVRLLRIVEKSAEDGYQIVADFIESLKSIGNQYETLLYELERSRKSPYCCDLYKKYNGCYPIWVFVEIIPFGRFVDFDIFCADRFRLGKFKKEVFLLLTIKPLRNATAHNNCIINDLSPNTLSTYPTNYDVSADLGKFIPEDIRDRKMSNVRLQQIISLLYIHKKLIITEGIHDRMCDELYAMVNRMYHHINYYDNNETIKTSFDFLKKVVDKWFYSAYNKNT